MLNIEIKMHLFSKILISLANWFVFFGTRSHLSLKASCKIDAHPSMPRFLDDWCSAMQRKTAVTAYFTSKQLLLFAFAPQCCHPTFFSGTKCWWRAVGEGVSLTLASSWCPRGAFGTGWSRRLREMGNAPPHLRRQGPVWAVCLLLPHKEKMLLQRWVTLCFNLFQ